MADIDGMLKNMLKESEEKAEALDDKGHLRLVKDVTDFLEDVKKGTFHDFHRNGGVAPKVELVGALEFLKDRVMKGSYDN